MGFWTGVRLPSTPLECEVPNPLLCQKGSEISYFAPLEREVPNPLLCQKGSETCILLHLRRLAHEAIQAMRQPYL